MAAEALAVIGSISAVVQLVDFSSKCISKGVELYRSGDGILDENAAIELAASHLTTLRVQVEDEAVRLNDVDLQNLCGAVTGASSELSGALAKVTIRGDKTKWKTLRKAIRSVWSKQEILDLEHKLSSLRSELNLHITIRARQQLERLGNDIVSQFRNTTEAQRRIIEAILQNHNVFEITLQDQTVLIRTVSEEIKEEIQIKHEATCSDFRQRITDSEAANRNEHDQTRQEMRIEAERVEIRNHETNNATAQQIESIEVEIVNVVNATSEINQAEHSQTQSQVAELRQALQELKDQMALRNQELREVLEAFQATKNKKSKKQLFDRSKVLTAAIMALETMYRSLKTVLKILQDRAKEMLENVQSSEFWAITQYAHRVASPSSTRDISQQLPVELGAREEFSNSWDNPRNKTYSAHDVYFAYFYPGALDRSRLVNATAMASTWKFHPECYSVTRPHFEGFMVDESPCYSSCMWMLASLALALEVHLRSEDAAFEVLSEALDKTVNDFKKPNSFSNGPLTSRLKADINYWISFAKSRRMQDGMSGESFKYDSLQNDQKKDLIGLLALLLRRKLSNSEERVHWTPRGNGGPALTIVRSLRDVGLPFIIHDSLLDSDLHVDFGERLLCQPPFLGSLFAGHKFHVVTQCNLQPPRLGRVHLLRYFREISF